MLHAMTTDIVNDRGKAMASAMAHDDAYPSVGDIDSAHAQGLVTDLARNLARSLASAPNCVFEQAEWLARLAALEAIRMAADRLAAEAAARAVSHGARYPALGKAAGTSRQNARVRWPGLAPVRRRRTSGVTTRQTSTVRMEA
jgi:hypothetical protein